MPTIKECKAIAARFNKLKEDEDRLKFLKKHNNKVKVILDDSRAMVAFILTDDTSYSFLNEIAGIEFNELEHCYGWEDGTLMLFEFAGITAEFC